MRLALNYQRVDPTRGGAETYVVDLCHRLIQEGQEVDLYANAWRDDCLPPEVRKIHVPIEGWTRPGKLWSFAEQSARAMATADHDCTVGFINTWGTDVLIPQGGVHDASLEANSKRFQPGLSRQLYLLGKKLNPKRSLYRAIEARQYDPSLSTQFVAVSRMVQGHLERFHTVDPDRVHVIPNAINADRLRVDVPHAVRAEFRSKLGLRPTDLVALFVGHNYWLKGLQPLLKALALRQSRNPGARPIHLIACGGGHVEPFARMVQELKLTDTVHLAGFQDDIRPPFWASDFFILPTYYDPCSLVVFEALACGLPVVTTQCNGAGELITQGQEGFVVEHPDAIDELAQSFDALVDDEKRGRMSASAQILGREQSFGRHVSRLLDVFREVSRARQTPTARPLSRVEAA